VVRNKINSKKNNPMSNFMKFVTAQCARYHVEFMGPQRIGGKSYLHRNVLRECSNLYHERMYFIISIFKRLNNGIFWVIQILSPQPHINFHAKEHIHYRILLKDKNQV